MPEDESTPGTVIGKLTASVTGQARDEEGHLLDAEGNRVDEGDQE